MWDTNKYSNLISIEQNNRSWNSMLRQRGCHMDSHSPKQTMHEALEWLKRIKWISCSFYCPLLTRFNKLYRGDGPDLYSGGAWFEYLLNTCYPGWGISWFSSAHQGSCRDKPSLRRIQLLFKDFPIHHSYITLPSGAIVSTLKLSSKPGQNMKLSIASLLYNYL
jgi:hypothetical protein